MQHGRSLTLSVDSTIDVSLSIIEPDWKANRRERERSGFGRKRIPLVTKGVDGRTSKGRNVHTLDGSSQKKPVGTPIDRLRDNYTVVAENANDKGVRRTRKIQNIILQSTKVGRWLS